MSTVILKSKVESRLISARRNRCRVLSHRNDDEAWGMFHNLSDDGLLAAVDELINCLGVKEDIPLSHLFALLKRGQAEACAQQIATMLGLPIHICLTCVAKDFSPDRSHAFRSSALAQTDSTGRGIEGIAAQVVMPKHIPMLGTSQLHGYPIAIHVSEACHEYPETFVAVMLHELSHVLLRSLCHPQQDSELHADLVPLLLGFREVVARGRTTFRRITQGNVTKTHTTSYGYLTDSQFKFVCETVATIVENHRHKKKTLLTQVAELDRKLRKVAGLLAQFRDFLRYVDDHPTSSMEQEDATKIVGVHKLDYSQAWEACVAQARIVVGTVNVLVRSLDHYTRLALQEIAEHTRTAELLSEELDQVAPVIKADIQTLRRHVGLPFRFRRALRLLLARTDVDTVT